MQKRLIAVANEKGGVGKTTFAAHSLSYMVQRPEEFGRVMVAELDHRTPAMLAYLSNRKAYNQTALFPVKMPLVSPFMPGAFSERASRRDRRNPIFKSDWNIFHQTMSSIKDEFDTLLFDCPGVDSYLAQFALEISTTIITPLKESPIDVSMYVSSGVADRSGEKRIGPRGFGRMVLGVDALRQRDGYTRPSWRLVWNDVDPRPSDTERECHDQIRYAAQEFNASICGGVQNRAAYRRLYRRGLTVLDIGWPTAEAHQIEADEFETAKREMSDTIGALLRPDNTSRLAA